MIKQFLVTFEIEEYNGESLEDMQNLVYYKNAVFISEEVIDLTDRDTEMVTARDIEKVFG